MDLGTTLSVRLRQAFPKSDAVDRFVEKQKKIKKRIPATLRDLKITDEDGNLVSLILNPVQRELMEKLGLDPDDPDPLLGGKKWRKRILKARREGVSTLILALYFLDTYNNPNRRTLVVAHEGEATQSIFEMVGRFYDNLPSHKKIPKKRSNRKELYWQLIDSRIYCATAGTDNVGSGSTLHNVLKSERAKWKGLASQIAALDASIDEAARLGNILEETTAQGMNFFFADWQESSRGEGAYEPIFFPWFQHPLYVADVPEAFERTEDEERRAKAFNLTDGQLQWYREKRKERKGLMPQEYPDTPIMAFLTSGKHFFDNEALMKRHLELQTPDYPPIRDLVFHPDDAMWLRKVYGQEVMDEKTGNSRYALEVYRLPQRDHYYIVTADPVYDRPDGDNASADVIDADTWEQVAHLWGKWEPHEFGLILSELGWWYNTALVGVLAISMGTATIDALIHTAHYPKQTGRSLEGVFYFYPSELKQQIKREDQQRVYPGWPENEMTKAWMLDKLHRALIMDPGLTLNSKKTVEEGMTFIHQPGGGAGAEEGAHDDCISSIGLGAALLNLRFERRAGIRQELQPVDPIRRFERERRY